MSNKTRTSSKEAIERIEQTLREETEAVMRSIDDDMEGFKGDDEERLVLQAMLTCARTLAESVDNS